MSAPTKMILLLLGCYLAACFVPNAGSFDVMAPQFLAFNCINLLAMLHLLFRAKELWPVLKARLLDPLSIVVLLFVFWQLLSVTAAVNKVEALLNVGRWLTGILIYLQLGLLKKETGNRWITIVVILLGGMLFLESAYVLVSYITGLGKETFSLLIYGLRGTTGNKNVLAASMALKLPFVLYGFHLFKDYRKYLTAFLIFTGSLAIFLVNARAAILSVGFLFTGYLLFSSFGYLKNRTKQHLKQVAIVSGILLFSLAISQWMLRAGLQEVEGNNGRTSYGTVLSRMSAIEINNQSSNNRFRLWKDALDYTGKHWLLGAGTGNWKLESIQYTSLEDNDLYVPYHAHNDFLETAAETGVPGLLLYIALYIVCGWKLLLLIRKSSDAAVSYLSLALFFSLMAYGVDAFFNFPSERPVMQLLFWMILAFTLVLSSKENSNNLNSKKSLYLFPIILLLLSFSLVHYSYGYYSSMKLQAKMLSEYNAEPVYPTEEIEEGWKKSAAFPNISAQYTLPLASMVARYHIRDGNYETALQLIEEAKNNNPYIYFNEFLKGFIYLKKGRYDSASVYTSSSFHNRPRCKPYFKNHMTAALMVRDSMELEKTFHRYLQFRKEPYAWELYLGALYEWRGASGQDLLQQMERVRKEFPEDEGLKKLEILMKGSGSLQPINEDTAKNQKAAQLRQSAEDNFARQRYALAARQFKEAFGLNAADLSLLENAGLCLYASGEYNKALQSFESVMEKGGLTGGKSEFYKALSLIALQRKSEACTWLAKALERGYDPAQVTDYQRRHCQ